MRNDTDMDSRTTKFTAVAAIVGTVGTVGTVGSRPMVVRAGRNADRVQNPADVRCPERGCHSTDPVPERVLPRRAHPMRYLKVRSQNYQFS
ncbi:hypothetical protein E3O53_00225 [Cryobacterium sp. TMT2-18-3]|uniref:hypothetical protein n=1 Tax=unclassified Cryobacterium TaxID=2649013 RepID=UPI00106AB837|nr:MULTISPECIES: hypothetical protein [unclassified Cryobacterium]TFC26785.1 hypothetical protein E3O22_10960 [Cryobacterium sp. TMT2-18-2]TFC68781.1 hypothetical protein E3O53_00225 [Cryobacterium sp. TMT2-18-3]